MKLLALLLSTFFTVTMPGQAKQTNSLSQFLPKGYYIFEKIKGDLNKDGVPDLVLIIKGTDKSKIVTDDLDKKQDRNRRGIIVLFNLKNHYQLAAKNYDCFSSENEDGGVYFPPDLIVEIKKGNLCIHFAHGRYGYWRYIFRFQRSDFELIGYDSAGRSTFESDYVTFDETSINFLTQKKVVKKVAKVDADGNEMYDEKWQKIKVNTLIKLSKVKDFDDLDVDIY